MLLLWLFTSAINTLSEARTAKRFGEIKVLDFSPSWHGETEEFDNIRFEDARLLYINHLN